MAFLGVKVAVNNDNTGKTVIKINDSYATAAVAKALHIRITTTIAGECPQGYLRGAASLFALSILLWSCSW